MDCMFKKVVYAYGCFSVRVVMLILDDGGGGHAVRVSALAHMVDARHGWGGDSTIALTCTLDQRSYQNTGVPNLATKKRPWHFYK